MPCIKRTAPEPRSAARRSFQLGQLQPVRRQVAAASGPEAFSYASAFFGSIIGRIILFGYTWALLHHMFGGIRHLIWDTGIGLSTETSTKLAQATLVASLALTLILWVGIVVFG